MVVMDLSTEAAVGQRVAVAPALLKRLDLLPDSDRAMVALALEGRVSRREIAQLLGLPPGTVSRRLRRLGNALHDPIVVALVERPIGLPAEYRQLGIEHFLLGFSTRRLADLHQMTRHEVRKALEHIRGWFRGVTGRQRL